MKLGLLATNPHGSAFEFTPEHYQAYGYDSGHDLDGGEVLSPVELDNPTIIDEINKQPCKEIRQRRPHATATGPQLEKALYEGTRYFRGMASAYISGLQCSSPVDDYCQSNNVVLISDSYSTDG